MECIWQLDALLGEGPLWDDRSATLWFTDIKGRALHRFDPHSGIGTSVAMDGEPGFMALTQSDALIVGMDDALYRHDPGAKTERLAAVPMPPRNRLNDATVGPDGQLWFGSMDNGETLATGEIYRFDGQSVVTCETGGGLCPITNGPAVSPDGRLLYHVDTAGGIIWRHSITGAGLLVAGEPWVTIDPAEGYPDGITVDAAGHVWLALWGGWGVRRYSPAGVLQQSVPVPCAQVTKLAFGGDDFRTAYVTTARTGLDEAALAGQPLAGGLFRFDVATPGLPANRMVLADVG